MKKSPLLRDYDRLIYAKDAVRITLDSHPSIVDMHDIGYWAKEVENLRRRITDSL